MAYYYVNKDAQPNGDHEVHQYICQWLPNSENRIYLGDFSSCGPAVAKAKDYYHKSNGCATCSPDCHTT